MIKRPFGWDRQTIIGPDARKLGGVLPWLQGISPLFLCHYPVFQIVDGDGKRTEHYSAYLDWANNDTTCTESTFRRQLNRGQGTSLVPRLTAGKVGSGG